MKKLLFLALISTCTLSSMIEYKLSYPHGVLVFLKTMAKEPHEAVSLLKEGERLGFYKNKNHKKAIELYKEVNPFLNKSISFDGHKTKSFNISQIIVMRSIQSKTLDDFSNRITGLLPLDQEMTFIKSLKLIDSFYMKKIWKPNFETLKYVKNEFLKRGRKINETKLFHSFVKFYESSWPKERKFTVGLHPIPVKKGHSTAQSLGAFESVGVLMTKSKNAISDKYSVVIHEMAHSIYHVQSKKVQNKWRKWFSIDHKASKSAYKNINEGLATALGNGYTYKKLVGHLDMSDWYNHRVINGFAKSIFPLVEDYLKKNKSVDDHFVKKAITNLYKKFPYIHREYSSFMRQALLTYEGEQKFSELSGALRNVFRANSIWGFQGYKSEKVRKKYKELYGDYVNIFIAKKSELDKLDSLKGLLNISNFSKLKKSLRKVESAGIITFGKKDVPHIFIQYQKYPEIKKILEKMKKDKVIKKDFKVYKL